MAKATSEREILIMDRYYLVTKKAAFTLWDYIQEAANNNKAQIISIDNLCIESITDKDQQDMTTREDATFQLKILVDGYDNITGANNMADIIMEEAQEQFDDDEDDEEDEEDEDLDDEEFGGPFASGR